jgi:hypothetical protein
MKRIILFRFHENPDVCENRLKLLKILNPEIGIFSYFEKNLGYEKFKKKLDPYLEDVYLIENKSSIWFWKNGDLAMRLWYKNVGCNIDFDMLHLVEWDLLLLDRLESLYKNPEDSISLSGLTLLSNIEDQWAWTCREKYLNIWSRLLFWKSRNPDRKQWRKLLSIAKRKFGYCGIPYASLGPGTCVPKKFLEAYSKIDVPELAHDELRLPLFGQILGFKLYDTGFYGKWFDRKDEMLFNCDGNEISINAIKNEICNASGKRVFHPFRKQFDLENLNSLLC